MIVYKWVYKKNGKYYSLMNYGYCRLDNMFKTNQPPYEIGKTYTNYKQQAENLKSQFLNERYSLPKFVKAGFYFWTKHILIPTHTREYMLKLNADINSILQCEVENDDILSYERMHCSIRVKRFKVIKEIPTKLYMPYKPTACVQR